MSSGRTCHQSPHGHPTPRPRRDPWVQVHIQASREPRAGPSTLSTHPRVEPWFPHLVLTHSADFQPSLPGPRPGATRPHRDPRGNDGMAWARLLPPCCPTALPADTCLTACRGPSSDGGHLTAGRSQQQSTPVAAVCSLRGRLGAKGPASPPLSAAPPLCSPPLQALCPRVWVYLGSHRPAGPPTWAGWGCGKCPSQPQLGKRAWGLQTEAGARHPESKRQDTFNTGCFWGDPVPPNMKLDQVN